MRKGLCILLVFLFCFMMFTGLAFAQDYRLMPNDVLQVSVWGYADLSGKDGSGLEIIVRPDGKIQFPLVGEIQTAGLTLLELNNALTSGLSEYIIDPKVTANVYKYHTTRVYVLGEVNKPGMYEIDKQHNLLDAVGVAGGYTKDAAKKNVFIVRKDSTSKPLKANLLDIMTKGDMTQNYALAEGDVVYLTSNGRLDFAKDILPWISATYYIKDMNKDN